MHTNMLEYKKYLHGERAQDSRFILEQSTRNFAKISQSDSKSTRMRVFTRFLLHTQRVFSQRNF